jgi:glycerol-3-phosphate dehydrogenase (NAD(P)+)
LKIVVFGAGAWGTALAIHAATKFPVGLWVRSKSQFQEMLQDRENSKYLPGRLLPDGVCLFADLGNACAWSLENTPNALWVSGVPMSGLRSLAKSLGEYCNADAAVNARPNFLWLCKGVEQHSSLLAHQILNEAWPSCPAYGALSGPSFADEVAAGLPCALTVATSDEALAKMATQAFHHTQMRVYASTDVIGVELAGALKNVIAVATGVCDGLNLGLNARAALITRGLAEISRLGTAMGAQPETFMGLAGMGDLVLTCTGNLSRNRRVGLELAQGQALEQVLLTLGHVAEGVACASAAAELAEKNGVEMPILNAMNAVIAGRLDAQAAIKALVSRKAKAEVA